MRRGQKRMLETVLLELQMVVSHLMCWELNSDPLKDSRCSYSFSHLSYLYVTMLVWPYKCFLHVCIYELHCTSAPSFVYLFRYMGVQNWTQFPNIFISCFIIYTSKINFREISGPNILFWKWLSLHFSIWRRGMKICTLCITQHFQVMMYMECGMTGCGVHGS